MTGYIIAILLTLLTALIVIIWFIYRWYNDTKVRRRSGNVVELIIYCFMAALLTYILGYWLVKYTPSMLDWLYNKLFIPI